MLFRSHQAFGIQPAVAVVEVADGAHHVVAAAAGDLRIRVNAQAWLIQIGDVSSGLFSLAIAFQTFIIIVVQRDIPYKIFCSYVVGIWVFCLTLSLISPNSHTNIQK